MLVDYRKLDTFIHRLNPKVTLLYCLFVIICSVVWTDPIYCTAMTILTALIASYAKFPWKQISWFLKFALVASGIIMVVQGFTFDENLLHQEWYRGIEMFHLFPDGGGSFTLGGFLYGFAASLKIYMVVFAIGTLGFTVSPADLMQLLSRSKIASRKFIFIFSTAWRFIPIIQGQVVTLMDAQKTRGMELDKGNFIDRLKKMVPIVTPLLSNALEIGTNIALTMEARAFGSEKNTKFIRPMPVTKRDRLMMIGMWLLIAALVVSAFFHIGAM